MLTTINLATVRRLAKEVETLALIVQAEATAERKRSGYECRFGPPASKNTAALRRRSMDLTRALADLRSSTR
jgi:hypothetical protein